MLSLSVTDPYGWPLNVIDHLSAGEFTNVPIVLAMREDVAGPVLRGAYPEVRSKSRRGRPAGMVPVRQGAGQAPSNRRISGRRMR